LVDVTHKSHVLEVWGDFACFSRPEMSVERFSYPCPTPSAARAIFDSIYFKPQFYWQVTRIELLTHPNFVPLRRNEVKDRASETMIKKWMKGSADPEPLLADADKSLTGSDQKGRTQRQTMALRFPRYRLHARIVARDKSSGKTRSSCDAQFVRRARQGKCFQQPYLGCREFVAFFKLIEDEQGQQPPCHLTQDLGLMLYDVFDLRHDNHSTFRKNWKNVRPSISMFRAQIRDGVLEVPPIDSDEVLSVPSLQTEA